MEWLIELNNEFILPNTTFLLNVDPKICLDRIGKRDKGFEFFEEEQQDLEIDQMIKEKMFGVIDHLKEIKVNFNQQQQIKNGINVSLIGWVNAGKSTLF